MTCGVGRRGSGQRSSGRFVYVFAALCVLCILVAPKADSHESSTSYLKLDARDDGTLSGSLDVGVLDLSWSVPLDTDGDGRVLWNEVEAAQPGIARLVADRLIVERGGRQCAFHVTDVLVTHHVGEPYLSLPLVGRCDAAGLLAIRSDLFFGEDSGHRTLFDVHTGTGSMAGFLMASGRQWRQSQAPNPWRTFGAFVVQGIGHVWTGTDHLAFLLSLLLPCALTAGRGAWRPADGLKVVLRDLLRIITAFTVAHSITLGLATLHVVSVSARIIEPLIAATIIIAALLNLFPLPRQSGFRKSFAYAGEAVDRGYSVLVFPEGRHTEDGKLRPFRSGIGLLVNNLRIPVVPVRIDGLFEVKQSGKKFAAPGAIQVRIGRPVRFAADRDPEEIARELERKIEEL